MKKIICLLLACLMLVPTFALAYDGTAPVSAEKKTLSILTTNSASLVLDWENMTWWQNVLEKANIELEIELIDASAYNDAVSPRLAAGRDLPDIVYLPNPDNDLSLANSGLFVDLAPYYEKNAVHINNYFEEFPTLKQSLTTPEGGMYYIPMLTPDRTSFRCVMINEDYLAKLNMKKEDITDLESFTEYLRAVKATDLNGNGEHDEIPLFIRAGMIGLLRLYFGIEGESFFEVENGKVICNATDDRYKDFLTWANMCYKEGLIYNEFPTASYDVQSTLMTTNSMGSIFHFVSNCTGYSTKINPEWNRDVDAPLMYPLALKGPGTEGEPVVWGRSVYSGFAWAITTACEDPELAFNFMDYMFSEEVSTMSSFGVEGVDYHIVDGEYVFTEVYIKNENAYRGNNGYNCGALPNLRPKDAKDITQCKAISDAIDVLKDYKVQPTIGYGYYPEEDNEIISNYLADLNTYLDEQMLAFILGNRSLDEWDAYVAAVNAMGAEEVIGVYQRALDRMAE